MKYFLTDEQQQLCALLRMPLPPGFSIALLNEGRVWETAVSHKVTSVVAWNAAQQVGWDALPASWRQAYDEADTRISAYLGELERIAGVLADRKIAVSVLENGALAHAILPQSGLYTFGDFDLLVAETALPQIHPVIEAAGYRLVSQSNGRAEYCCILDHVGEPRLNFQTNLVARRWVHANSEPDFGTLWQRSQVVAGSAARILGAEDFLYQLCVHNASHAYVHKPGIRLHLDVDWYLKQVEVDWPSFINMVNRFDVATKVYFSLLIPKALFETPVPEATLAQLRPSAWKEKTVTRLINKAGLFDPHEKNLRAWNIFCSTCCCMMIGAACGAACSRTRHGCKSDIALLTIGYYLIIISGELWIYYCGGRTCDAWKMCATSCFAFSNL